MNKLIKLNIIFIFLVFINCKTSTESIRLNQKKALFPVIIKSNKEKTYIINIKYPNSIEINNNSVFNKEIIRLNYYYNDSISNWANRNIELFEIKNGKKINISNNKKKNILPNRNLKYLYYTRHFIDSTKVFQEEFKPYVEKMLTKNQDTLHIGTVADFKQKHKDLFERLTKNDSISIQLLDNDKLGERITVPVKWD